MWSGSSMRRRSGQRWLPTYNLLNSSGTALKTPLGSRWVFGGGFVAGLGAVVVDGKTDPDNGSIGRPNGLTTLDVLPEGSRTRDRVLRTMEPSVWARASPADSARAVCRAAQHNSLH